MAGHSKWKNIQYRKGAQDAKKAKISTKLIREITVSAQMGGGDAHSNPRLRAAVDKALSNNMTRDTIDRAIKRGVGDEDNSNMHECNYEGYGPAGTAVLVECMTDNKNRTVGEVRHAFTKSGGNLGTDGSVAYLFKQQGVISFEAPANEDKIMEIAIDAGADDVVVHDDGSIDVMTSFADFGKVKDALDTAGLKSVHAEVSMEASIKVMIDNKEEAEKVIRLIDRLEELDDVQNVYSNVEFTEGVLKELA